jgi:hypothetical protein
MALSTRLMDSFSQRSRFTYANNTLTVMIPNGSRTNLHPRASLPHLKALLTPQVRLTRGGNISQHQPAPPDPEPYDFYLAQLVHYGLDFHFEIEAAQRALEIEIRLGRLRVPASLVKLEKDLKREFEREQMKARESVITPSPKVQNGRSREVAIAIESSEEGGSDSEGGEIKPPAPAKIAKRKQRRKKNVVSSSSEDESMSSSDGESSSTFTNESDEESDTILASQVPEESSSSSDSDSSSSEEEVQNPKQQITVSSFSDENNSDESSAESDSASATASDSDPFLDRKAAKRIKLAKAEDNILPSVPAPAPYVSRQARQPPPSAARIRRIKSHANIPSHSQPAPSATKPALSAPASAPSARTQQPAKKQSFLSPDKRPKWTIPIPVRPSPQRNTPHTPTTPKSVSFSQVRRETPTRVHEGERGVFSQEMGSSGHRRTPSFGEDIGLRGILKKTATDATVAQGVAGTQARLEGEGKSEVGGTRKHKRKRKSKDAADANAGRDLEREIEQEQTQNRRVEVVVIDGAMDLGLDGTVEQAGVGVDTEDEKPYITSDLVNGKPVQSSQRSAISTSGPIGGAARAIDSSGQPGGGGGFVAVNSKQYREQMRGMKLKGGAANPGMSGAGLVNGMAKTKNNQRHSLPGSTRLEKLGLKGGSVAPADNLGIRKKELLGGGSRGSLVRAGQVY